MYLLVLNSGGPEIEMGREDLGGAINTTHPFNRLLVDAGHAHVKDFTNNEFDPATWWTEGIPEADPITAPVLSTTLMATGGQFMGSLDSINTITPLAGGQKRSCLKMRSGSPAPGGLGPRDTSLVGCASRHEDPGGEFKGRDSQSEFEGAWVHAP